MKPLLFTFLLISFSTHAQPLKWVEVANGIWKVSVGKPENYDLLKAADVKPNISAIKKLPTSAFPLTKNDIVVRFQDGKTYLRFPLVKEEQLYGFGLNFQTIHQRGRILRLHVDHYGNSDNGRTHSPTPFYVSSKGYGVFINSARYLDVYAGSNVRKDSKNPPELQDRNTDKNWSAKPYSDAVEILVPSQGVEFYVFAGPKPMDVIRRFNLFNGGGCLPPRWGLGFTQRVNRLYTADDVKKEAAEFEEKGYPLDFIGLEPGWQSASYPCTFEWDKARFPDPARFVKEMTDKHIRLNLWTNPYVSPKASIYSKIKPFTASHTVWVGTIPDLTLPQARKIFFDKFEQDHINIGISGYKIDEVDGYDSYLFPDVTTFPSGRSAEQIRQTYGLLVQKYSTEVFHKKNRRTYGLVRGSNAGGVSFPYVIYNDNYSHQDFITALINSGFAGVLWTPEVRASKTSEEWLRRMQTVCFSPMAMINAWSSSTKPWSFPDVANEVKEIAQLRMQMMPYWYTEFAKYHFEGTPPFRSVNLEDGFITETGKEKNTKSLEENPYEEALNKEIKDQYMAGEYLLVAPVFTGQTARKVILPKGNWYDFYTGDYVGNGEIITVTTVLNKIPVFVKDGGIIPMMPPMLHAPEPNQKADLEIRHYGKKNSTSRLYDDDGETFDYEKGAYTWRELKAEKQANGQWSGTISAPQVGKPNTIANVSWKFMTK
jgi:alpha-D-xyloside xylohydrolase